MFSYNIFFIYICAIFYPTCYPDRTGPAQTGSSIFSFLYFAGRVMCFPSPTMWEWISTCSRFHLRVTKLSPLTPNILPWSKQRMCSNYRHYIKKMHRYSDTIFRCTTRGYKYLLLLHGFYIFLKNYRWVSYVLTSHVTRVLVGY